MFGTRYLAGASGVLPIVIAGGGLALLYLLVTYTVAIEDARWSWLLALGVAMQVDADHPLARLRDPGRDRPGHGRRVLLLLNEARFHSLLLRPARD